MANKSLRATDLVTRDRPQHVEEGESGQLTVSGVAVKYGLAEFRVRQLSNSGVLPHVRDNNGRRCFNPDKVHRAMSKLGVSPVAKPS